jgi:hypothetical protein
MATATKKARAAQRAARYVHDRAGLARFGAWEADRRQPSAAG